MVTMKKNNKGQAKLLAAVLALAMVACAIFVFAPADGIEGADGDAEDSTAESISAAGFLALDTDRDGIITLENDYILEDTVVVTESLTIVMDGHTISITNKDMFNVEGELGTTINFEIVGDDESRMIVEEPGYLSSVIYCTSSNKAVVNYTIEKGYYEACYVISVGDNSHFGGAFTMDGAEIRAIDVESGDNIDSEGIWISYGGLETAIISNTTIVSDGIGIYLGVVKNATLTNVEVTSDDTALEIKSGNVTISGGSYTSNSYLASTGEIGMSQSGSGVDTICINNGYSRADTGDEVNVTFENGVSISNTSADAKKYVQVTAGLVQDTETVCDDPITVTGLPVDQIEIYRASGSDTNAISIVPPSGKEVEIINDAESLQNSAASGNYLIISANVDSEDTVSLSNGTIVDIPTGISYSGDITISDSDSAVNVNGGSYSGTITTGTGTKTNTAVFDGIRGNFTVSVGSIVIDGEIEGGEIVVEADSDAKIVGVIYAGAKVTVENGATLTIVENSDKVATKGLINNGEIVNNGTVRVVGPLTNMGTVTNNEGADIYVYGTMTNNGNIDNEGTIYGTIAGAQPTGDGSVVALDDLGLKDTINADLTIDKPAFLAGDLTIPAGKTLTIVTGGSLDMLNYNITVYGTLIVKGIGSIDSTGDVDNQIILKAGGVFDNSGRVGQSKAITVVNGTNDDDQSVVLKGVSGASVTLEKDSGNSTYSLYLSGSVTPIPQQKDAYLTANNVKVDSALSIAKSVTLNADGVEVLRDVAVAVNGSMTVDGAGFFLNYGASVAVNGSVTGTVSSYVGIVSDNTGDVGVILTTGVTFEGKEKGVTISVGRISYADPEDSTKTITEQIAYIGGTASQISSGVDSTITVTGTVYVSEKLTVNKGITVAGGTFDVASSGLVQVNDGGDFTSGYVGASYDITDAEGVTIGYYTSLASAVAAVAGVENPVIYVSGEFEFSGTMTVTDGMSILPDDEATEIAITVTEGSEITVSADGVMDGSVFDEDGGIQGIVFVVGGSGCVPAPGSYAVKSMDTESGDTTYSGFKVAIDNAASGDVIDVVGEAEYDGSLTIADGVTVNVNVVELRVTGNLTIPENAKLVLKDGADLIVGTANKNATITVYGLLDATDGTVTNQTDATVNLYSTGTTEAGVNGSNIESNATGVGTPEIAGKLTVNAAYYDDGERIYTSVAKAIAYCEANKGYPTSVTVTGTVTEKDAIDSDGISIVIANGAKVTLGDVTLVKASIRMADRATTGWYTANVSGLTGTGDDAVLSTVSVTETTAEIENKVTVNAQGANVCETTIDKVKGKSTAITAGKITYIGGNINATVTNNTYALSVSSGAELVIYSDITVSGAGIDNDGTITVMGQVTFSGKAATFNEDEEMTSPAVTLVIGGNIVVDDEAELTIVNTVAITGTLTVQATEDDQGVLEVTGTLQVGETPEYLGASGTVTGIVKLEENGKVVVFDGSSVADATIMNGTEAAKSTSYTINGIAFATVYGNGDIVDINEYVVKLKDLASYEGLANAAEIVWYSGETKITGEEIGTYASVSTEIDYASVSIEVSVMPRITLSIDGVVYTAADDNIKQLSIGTHTVTVSPYPGYSGDITVTFNGVTVTDGKIVITADMIGEKAPLLSVTGNIVVDNGTVTTSGDDGMGLTDYLLIILVVLIAIMAIIVALRLTRS